MPGAHTAWLDMARGRSPTFLCDHHRDHICRWQQETLTRESRDPEGNPQAGYHTECLQSPLSLDDGHTKPKPEWYSVRGVCVGVLVDLSSAVLARPQDPESSESQGPRRPEQAMLLFQVMQCLWTGGRSCLEVSGDTEGSLADIFQPAHSTAPGAHGVPLAHSGTLCSLPLKPQSRNVPQHLMALAF